MAKIFKIFAILIFFSAIINLCWGSKKSVEGSSDHNLTSVEIIRKYGYPAEVHPVETEDGYILEVHRVPYGKNSNLTNGIPLLLVHGLVGNSAEFLLLKSESLTFVLADAGYDVWITNFRGNPYSRNHKVLSPDQSKFWDFSWHENGIYDIPASIDYILKYTQRDQLLYLGYSMGTTAFFVMASQKPEYQKKIKGAILMGPTAYIKHARSPVRHFAPFSRSVKGPLEFVGNIEVFKQTNESQHFTSVLCADRFFCRNIVLLLSGTDIKEFNTKTLPVLLTHFPSSSSIKTIAHYGQLILSGKFQQYDHGIFKNFIKYRQPKPPEYNLKAVNVPLSLFISPNDFFNSRDDLEHLLRELSTVKFIYVVPFPPFTHLDFLVAEHAKELVYEKIVEQAQSLINQGAH